MTQPRNPGQGPTPPDGEAAEPLATAGLPAAPPPTSRTVACEDRSLDAVRQADGSRKGSRLLAPSKRRVKRRERGRSETAAPRPSPRVGRALSGGMEVYLLEVLNFIGR